MRGTERRNIKYKFIRNVERNAVRSVVEYEIFNTTYNGKLMHFVRKVRSHVDKFFL